MAYFNKRFIRLIYTTSETDWVLHTRKMHRQLVENPPEYVEIRLRDFYPNLHEGNAKTEFISFPVFHVIAREAILKEEEQEKANKRHIDEREIDDYILSTEAEHYLHSSAEEEFFRLERQREWLNALTSIQRERYNLYYIYGYTIQEIASAQGCHTSTVFESLQAIAKKIKKML